jgi:HSP20 family protein
MTQIGIGELKHAKTASTKGETKKEPLSFNARPHEMPTRASAASAQQVEEGQLSVDIFHKEDEMTIVCPIAGVKKEDIRVAIQDDVLTIRGERKPLLETVYEKPLVKELIWGTFSRSIVLPDHIDRKKISARVTEHMLIIQIPKTEDFKTRIIHINGEE